MVTSKEQMMARFPRLWADVGQGFRQDFPRTYDPEVNPDAGVIHDGAIRSALELSRALKATEDHVAHVLQGLPFASEAGFAWNERCLEKAWLHPFTHLMGRAPSAPRGDLARFVYFIRCGAFVKIGSTNDTRSRLGNLQSANPNKLLLVKALRGGTPLERNLHRLFAHHREHLEWFRLDGDLQEYIAAARGEAA